MRLQRLLVCFSCVSVLLGNASVVQGDKPQPPNQKLVQKSLRGIRHLYRDDIKMARTSKQKSQLARKLRQDALETLNDVAGRYVLLVMARDFAIQSRDAVVIDEVLRTLGELYELDRHSAAATTFGRALGKLRQENGLVVFANTVARLSREAASAEHYAAAKRLAGLTVAAGRKARRKQITQMGTDLRRELEIEEREYGLAKAARLKLAKNPQDLTAKKTLGRYLCLTRDQWEKGLPLLAAGKGTFQAAARAELKLTKKSAKALVGVGDLWWELGAKQSKRNALAVRRHAAGLYRQAIGELTGLARVRLERRLKTLPTRKMKKLSLKEKRRRVLRLALGGKQSLFLRHIAPGRFTMGSPLSEVGRGIGENTHLVELTKGFYIGATEVTQAQWIAVMGNRRSFRFSGATLPADSVTWEEANQLIARLNNSKLGKQYRFRLPTEAEWEYACRAGSATSFSFGEIGGAHRFAWHKGNSRRQTRPVASLRPNAWGLYDMNGNVWEWCSDWAGRYSTVAQKDPQGPQSGDAHRIRGGSFVSELVKLRAAYRARLAPGIRNSTVGIRLVCERR